MYISESQSPNSSYLPFPTDTYMSVEKISDDGYKKWRLVEKKLVEDEPEATEPADVKLISDEPIELELAADVSLKSKDWVAGTTNQKKKIQRKE